MERYEDSIQQEIIMWFRNNYCLKFHNPRYVVYSVPNDGKDVKEQMRKKATGMLPGVSDFIIDTGISVLYVEVKDEKGRQKPAQEEFQQRVEALGREYWLVRSLKDFQELWERHKVKLNLAV